MQCSAKICKTLYNQAKMLSKIESIYLSYGQNSIILHSAPQTFIEITDLHEDPLMLSLSSQNYNHLCIQHDPIKTMNRFRHYVSTLISKYPDQSKPIESYELEYPIVHKWQECQATPSIHQYLSFEETSSEEFVINILNNTIGNDFVNFPYINDSILAAIAKDKHPILIGIPEPLLRINIANSYSLGEIKEIYKMIIEYTKKKNEEDSEIWYSGYDAAHELMPEVFQRPRDIFTIAFLKEIASMGNVVALVSAPTFAYIQNFWDDHYAFDDINKCIDRRVEDTDVDLVEKHSILDVIMNTRAWEDKYMPNRFIYVDRKHRLDYKRKTKLKELFFQFYKSYNLEMEKIIQPIVDLSNSIK